MKGYHWKSEWRALRSEICEIVEILYVPAFRGSEGLKRVGYGRIGDDFVRIGGINWI